MCHAWDDTGTYAIRAKAYLDRNPAAQAGWSDPKMVRVLSNSPPPTPWFFSLPLISGDSAWFRVTTSAGPGDSVSFQISFGDETVSEWSPFFAGGAIWEVAHVYEAPDTYYARCRARDKHEALSEWSEPIAVIPEGTGSVKWWWIDSGEDEGVAVTSTLVLNDGQYELIYSGADDGVFYSIRASDGYKKHTGHPVQPILQNDFTGQPAYCEATQHIIIGNEDGELYAFTRALGRVWHWPGQTSEDSLTYIAWGTAAIIGNRIYCIRDNDSLYCFTDLGDSCRYEAAIHIQDISDPPVIDQSGYVHVGTDSRYLYKLNPDLTVVWQKTLGPGAELFAPAIGADGTVYCGCEPDKVFAINPDGSIRWSRQVLGEPYNIVVGTSALFVTTGQGHLYSLDPATGATIWDRQHSTTEVVTAPILAGDFIYHCDYDDVVFCCRQSDGDLLWKCACADYGPQWRKGRREISSIEGSPGITSTGDIIVVGADAMYCISGYTDRPLADAPWPKWQRDVYNTGKAGAR